MTGAEVSKDTGFWQIVDMKQLEVVLCVETRFGYFITYTFAAEFSLWENSSRKTNCYLLDEILM